MADALYRTYRPQTFADVVNQQHVRITLQHALEQDRVAHAYLFAGPRGVGKTTLARILARAVNCTKPGKNGEPCNKCPNCTSILSNSSLDIIEIDAASQTGVDNVRENIIQNARSIPAMAKRKVFIIDEVHMLSTSAFNALLKLLEEPPAHAMFILATTEVHRIPDTIISRTQRFDFKKVGVDDLVTRLQQLATNEKRQIDDEVAHRIARRAGGSVRDAETMLGQLFSFEEKRITTDIADLVLPRSDQQLIIDLLTAIIEGRTVDALTQFHKFCDEGGDIPNLVHDSILTARGILLSAVDPRLIEQVALEYDRQDVEKLLSLAGTTTVGKLEQIIEALLTAERRLRTAVMIELPVELAIITSTTQRISEPAAMPSVAAPILTASVPAPKSTDHTPKPPEPPAAPPPPPPKPEAAKPKKTPSSGQLTLNAVKEAWASIQRSIGLTHPSLGISIQHASIGELSDDEVELHVPFKLHADRLSDPKNGRPLVEALIVALGQEVRLKVIVSDNHMPAPAAPAPVVQAAPVVSHASIVKPATAPAGDLWEQVVSSFGDTA